MRTYRLPDIQNESGVKLVRKVNEVLRGKSDYENLRGGKIMSVGEVLNIPTPEREAYPSKWIKDCWTQEFGNRPPFPFTSLWAFVQVVHDLSKKLDVSPVKVVRRCDPKRVVNMQAYLNTLKRVMVRENEDESFQQWLRRIGG